jgi:hypothetical protein
MAKKEALEWAILPAARSIRSAVPDSDHDYDLFNAKIGEALVYGERPFGINLDWGDPTNSNHIRFARQGSATGPIRYKEMIAINVRGGGWLVYKKREVGINLGWSDTPRFEWRIDGGDPKDNVVIPGLISLHNSVEDDWLMYVPRDFGINLRWSGDREAAAWLPDAVTVGTILKKYYDKIP